jgi:hypothetical protein
VFEHCKGVGPACRPCDRLRAPVSSVGDGLQRVIPLARVFPVVDPVAGEFSVRRVFLAPRESSGDLGFPAIELRNIRGDSGMVRKAITAASVNASSAAFAVSRTSGLRIHLRDVRNQPSKPRIEIHHSRSCRPRAQSASPDRRGFGLSVGTSLGVSSATRNTAASCDNWQAPGVRSTRLPGPALPRPAQPRSFQIALTI